MNPWSLIVLAVLALLWGYAYMVRTTPLVLGGRELRCGVLWCGCCRWFVWRGVLPGAARGVECLCMVLPPPPLPPPQLLLCWCRLRATLVACPARMAWPPCQCLRLQVLMP